MPQRGTEYAVVEWRASSVKKKKKAGSIRPSIIVNQVPSGICMECAERMHGWAMEASSQQIASALLQNFGSWLGFGLVGHPEKGHRAEADWPGAEPTPTAANAFTPQQRRSAAKPGPSLDIFQRAAAETVEEPRSAEAKPH